MIKIKHRKIHVNKLYKLLRKKWQNIGFCKGIRRIRPPSLALDVRQLFKTVKNKLLAIIMQ